MRLSQQQQGGPDKGGQTSHGQQTQYRNSPAVGNRQRHNYRRGPADTCSEGQGTASWENGSLGKRPAAGRVTWQQEVDTQLWGPWACIPSVWEGPGRLYGNGETRGIHKGKGKRQWSILYRNNLPTPVLYLQFDMCSTFPSIFSLPLNSSFMLTSSLSTWHS